MTQRFQGRAVAEFFYGTGTAPKKREDERMTETETYNPPYEELVRLRAEVERLRKALIEMANRQEPYMRFATADNKNGYRACMEEFKLMANRALLPPKEDKS